ncbi:MAG TPA: type II toxin-antitoxin system prevent-host-death family antitoxin [Vicinamibacteria bacterium]|nr:type II toxin-antitoxin system prevent-host-death family antitoxin [Vicinamibacteria bacterium]
MKFVSVRELRLRPGEVWKLAKRERDIVITANGRPIAILTGVDEGTFEDELDAIERARALRALDKIQRESVRKGTDKITEGEIEKEIGALRRRP